MMKKKEKDSIPVSSLKIFEKVEKEQVKTLDELSDRVTTLSDKIDNAVNVNVELQAKIVDLMSKITEMVEMFREIARFMRATPRMEPPELGTPAELMSASIEPAPGKGNVLSEVKELAVQNRQLVSTLKVLEDELRKGSTRDAIKKALDKSRRG